MVRQGEWVREALAVCQEGAPVAPVAPVAPRGTAAGRVRGVRAQLGCFLPRVRCVVAQARARVLDGRKVPATEKVLSLFEPHTRVVVRAKAGALVEFGRQVVLDEVEGGIVTRFHVLSDEESECHQALPAIQHHRAVFERPPRLVAGDRRLHTQDLEASARALGVQHVVIPRTSTLSTAQRARERQRSWRRRYRWRAGIQGRIHSLRRDYGLGRCRSHGLAGLERDVGWGVLASDLCHIARARAQHQPSAAQRAA